jgi:hypothetical protein
MMMSYEQQTSTSQNSAPINLATSTDFYKQYNIKPKGPQPKATIVNFNQANT